METCKLCGSKNMITYVHPKFDMLFHECLDCEVIYKDDRHKMSSIEEKKVYDHHENSMDNEGYVNYLMNFVDSAIIPFIKEGNVLDFGSGPNPVLKEILITKYNFKVSIYDYFYMDNKDVFLNHYDLITSTEVFEHLFDPINSIKQFYKMLYPGGIVSIMTLFHPKEREAFYNWFYIRDPSHVTFYTPKTFEVIAKYNGFKVLDTNQYRYITLMKQPIL